MAKKISHGRKKPLKPRNRAVPLAKGAKRTGSLAANLLALLSGRGQAMAIEELAESLALARSQLPSLQKTLVQLLDEGRIVKKGKRFFVERQGEPIRATLDLTSKGFGFAVPEGEVTKGGKDIFIAASNLGGASHGDAILVQVTSVARGRREGRVVEITSRGVTRICGIYRAHPGGGGTVAPDDERLPYTVRIHRGDELTAEDGQVVAVAITDYGSERQGPSGRVVEVLGDARLASVQIRMAILAAELREHFPAEVQAEAEALPKVVDLEPGRVDLRHLAHVTIDGETARDFDDAICVEEQENDGFLLYVSIADVSHYVHPGSAIDREAYQRGTSVYLPDRVLPMLPERLSNDLCSLVPDQDRPAFTAILTFDAEGRRTRERYCKSLIRSRRRYTYTLINRILFEREPKARAAEEALLPMLERARALTARLKNRRIRRGSLEFNLPEPEVILDEDRVAAISLAVRNRAHMLIEDCMLAANEAVAETLARAGRPVLYRIHEHPDPGKLETFTDAAKALGFDLPRTEVGPAWFARIIEQAQESPSEYIVNNLLLRTMQQARYAPENVGHFGLAAEYYLHFTSPIRRYPDLVAHRVLQRLLARTDEGGSSSGAPLPSEADGLAAAGTHLSQCERRAIDVERNVHARCSALFLLGREGEVFGAIISGVTSFGLYLTLDESFISGFIPLTAMNDDYYLHDSRRYRLIGERTNRIYQLGDQVRARLAEVDLQARRLNFSLAGEDEETNSEDGRP